MTITEFSDQFDVLYNNITSNQAPGLNEYEKSVFLTKAQEEVLKNYFNPKSNTKEQGFDDTRKRQADFSTLMRTKSLESARKGYSYTLTHPAPIGEDPVPLSKNGVVEGEIDAFDDRAITYIVDKDIFIIINEQVTIGTNKLTVVPISFLDYDRVMSKPFKYPPKYQAWRLITNSIIEFNLPDPDTLKEQPLDTISDLMWEDGTTDTPIVETNQLVVEILSKPLKENSAEAKYTIRYIKRPSPIIVGDLATRPTVTSAEATPGGTYEDHDEGDIIPIESNPVTIEGEWMQSEKCELPEELHQEVLQRAIELAKAAWATDQGQAQNTTLVTQMGQRTE